MPPARETTFTSAFSSPASETTGFPPPELTLHAVRARSALPTHQPTLRAAQHTETLGMSVPPTLNEGMRQGLPTPR